MYLAYFDESGDSGLVGSPTTFFVLACVLVHHAQWALSLDRLIKVRRILREKYKIPTRPEIKALDLKRGEGALRPLRLSPATRLDIYAKLMELQPRYLPEAKTFAVAIEKAPAAKNGWEPRETAWKFALERVDKFCLKQGESAMIFPDEGHGRFIRRRLREMRRFHHIPRRFGGGTFKIPTARLIEDPNDRQSHDSYFIQVADWNAYAAHRSMQVDPTSPATAGLWNMLGDQRLLEVNRNVGGPPGIKLYPQ